MNLGHKSNHGMEEEPKTLSLLTGVAASSSPPTEAELLESGGSKGLPMGRGAAVIAAVAVIAAGSVWMMRATQGEIAVAGGQEAESRIENFVAKRSQRDKLGENHPLSDQNMEALFQDADAVVAMFASDVSEKQVPLEYVKKNPFQLLSSKPTAGPAPVDNSQFARDRRLQELSTELGRYKLYSVMTGPRNVAVINGDFVQERQRLGSFTVAKIEPLSVTLSAAGETFRLTIETDPNQKR